MFGNEFFLKELFETAYQDEWDLKDAAKSFFDFSEETNVMQSSFYQPKRAG